VKGKMIIYPPFIADTIPGFVGSEITIPFELNPAVAQDSVGYFSLTIKEYGNNNIFATSFSSQIDWEKKTVTFTDIEFEGENVTSLTPKQYYEF
jgi:hypothetical protein